VLWTFAVIALAGAVQGALAWDFHRRDSSDRGGNRLSHGGDPDPAAMPRLCCDEHRENRLTAAGAG
jgi:hypothetical protein